MNQTHNIKINHYLNQNFKNSKHTKRASMKNIKILCIKINLLSIW